MRPRAILVLLLTAAIGSAQNIDRCSTRVIPVRVRARKNVAPPNETPSFRAELDGTPVAVESSSLIGETGRVVIVLDLGNTLHGARRSVAIAAAKDILVVTPKNIPIAFVAHSADAKIAVPFSADSRAQVNAALEQLASQPDKPVARTPLVDQISAGYLLLNGGHAGDDVFAVTDGGSDASSKENWDKLSRRFSESAVRLNAIIFRQPRPVETEGEGIGVRWTEDFLEVTGGRWIETDADRLRSRPESQTNYATELLTVLRNRGMLLTLHTQRPPAEFKQLKLQALHSDGRPMHFVDVEFPRWWPPCGSTP